MLAPDVDQKRRSEGSRKEQEKSTMSLRGMSRAGGSSTRRSEENQAPKSGSLILKKVKKTNRKRKTQKQIKMILISLLILMKPLS